MARLPGIGRKTALRLTYHLLRQPHSQSRRLAEALVLLTERVRACDRCHNLTESPLCALCADPRRDPRGWLPSIAYLARHLRDEGHQTTQRDLGIELVLQVFSKAGLRAIFAEVEKKAEAGELRRGQER